MSQIKTKFIENGAVTNAKVATGIDATKIADGSVTNTEFQYVGGVTSDIQTQLNGKQATGNYITALTGDVTASGPGSAASTIANDAVTTAKIAADAVTSAKVRLDNGATGLRARDVANTADITLIRLNSFDIIELPDNSGTQASIDVTNRYLISSANNITMDYENGVLNGPGGVISIDISNRTLKDSANGASIDYETRIAKDSGDSLAINYESRLLANSAEATVLNFETSSLVRDTEVALDWGTQVDLSIKPDVTNTLPRGILFENEDSTFASKVVAATGLTVNTTFTLPPTNGTAGYILSTDGAGETSWVAPGASVTYAKETFVLTGTDITNQFVTLTNTPGANTVMLLVKGGGVALEGASYDYSLSGAQLNFLNDLATGGGAALVAGDVLQVMYNY